MFPMPQTLAGVMLGATCVMGSLVAGAQGLDAIPGIQWRCVQEQDEDFHILCVPQPLRRNEGAPSPGAGAGNAPVPDLSSRGAEPLPQGRDLRPLALRGAEEVFSTPAWRLPLYKRPSNPLEVGRLLEAVLCGGVPRCTVSYGAI